MSGATVLVLATLDTKAEETDFLCARLAEHGLVARVIDLSLNADGRVLDGPAKLTAMEASATAAIARVAAALSEGVSAVLAIGGGTGGEIALNVMRSLPITFPKVLVTTLPFDPRVAVADTSIILVPTLADICGLNATLREVLENVAAMTAGLSTTRRTGGACVENPSVGITALGATDGAVRPLVAALRDRGLESTVFHSNGYGGAAFARFAEQGAFHAIVDLTPHELTRLHIAGAHVPMPARFSAGDGLPRVVLPGALNFLGLGERALLPESYRARPHYAHSGFFTHVQVTEAEMTTLATALAETLNRLTGPAAMIVPMGGFSHQDRPGGAIEAPALRQVFLERARAVLNPEIPVQVIDAHISSPEVTSAIVAALGTLAPPNKDQGHV